jgi:hypothetical protein
MIRAPHAPAAELRSLPPVRHWLLLQLGLALVGWTFVAASVYYAF